MTEIEIFENLMEPLRLELGNDSWEFLMKRGQIFIDQCVKANKPYTAVSGSLPLASGSVTKTLIPEVTYTNGCDKCGETFYTKDAFETDCPDCKERRQSNDR